MNLIDYWLIKENELKPSKWVGNGFSSSCKSVPSSLSDNVDIYVDEDIEKRNNNQKTNNKILKQLRPCLKDISTKEQKIHFHEQVSSSSSNNDKEVQELSKFILDTREDNVTENIRRKTAK